MPYEDPNINQFDVDENKRIIGVVTTDNPKNPQNTPQNLMNIQRPMILQMPLLQQMQTNQQPFPILFFLFPRIALLLMQRNFYQEPKKIGLKTITQLIRDNSGRIVEIVEFTQ